MRIRQESKSGYCKICGRYRDLPLAVGIPAGNACSNNFCKRAWRRQKMINDWEMKGNQYMEKKKELPDTEKECVHEWSFLSARIKKCSRCGAMDFIPRKSEHNI